MTDTTNMVFSESTNKTGLYELFQDLTKTNSSSYSAYKFARDANNALLDYFALAINASGKARVDDSNFSTAPEISIDLVASQFDYPLTSDADTNANQILEIERIECASESTADTGKFITLDKFNDLNEEMPLVSSRALTGIPSRFSQRGVTIYLDPTPSFSATNGLRVFFNRTPSYFAGTDTTKVAGIPHSHQEYLVYRPAYLYCITNIPQLAGGYLTILNQLKKEINNYYLRQNRDSRRQINMAQVNFM